MSQPQKSTFWEKGAQNNKKPLFFHFLNTFYDFAFKTETCLVKRVAKLLSLWPLFMNGVKLPASRLEPLQGDSLLFTTKFQEINGTHFIDLRRMKGWINLGAMHWFWIPDPWVGNPASWPLGHCSLAIAHFRN